MFINTILILESIIVGLITFLVGYMGFNITENRENFERGGKIQPRGIGIAFFFTGFIFHFILEFIGFNKFYCNRTCRKTMEYLN